MKTSELTGAALDRAVAKCDGHKVNVGFRNLTRRRKQMNEAREKLIDAVIEQIKNDIEVGDCTAIATLLSPLSDRHLKDFVPALSGEDESTEGESK